MKRTRRIAAFAALSVALFLFGCGGANTGALSGTVQYKGKSVKTGTVTVFDSQKQPHQGEIADGKYSIPNLPYGEVRLIVMSPNPAVSDGGRDGVRNGARDKRPGDAGKKAAEGWFPIPSKYGEMDKSPLKTTISGKTNDFPINLTE